MEALLEFLLHGAWLFARRYPLAVAAIATGVTVLVALIAIYGLPFSIPAPPYSI